MINGLIGWCLRNIFLVGIAVVFIILGGYYAITNTPVDAIPDIGEKQVIVYADWEGRSPQDVDNQVTFPLTTGLTGTPGVKSIRSCMGFGRLGAVIMGEIFLSASIPVSGRGNYFETADPFLIQFAVREPVITSIQERHVLVWGGHPAITPMIWAICEDMQEDYAKAVILYQSLFFEDRFPDENLKFQNVVHVHPVDKDREKSLLKMRHEMLSRPSLVAAFFIGGMDGTEQEYDIFLQHHPLKPAVLVPATGGAALHLARELNIDEKDIADTNFVNMFARELKKTK